MDRTLAEMTQLAQSLRDFFLAANAAQLARACNSFPSWILPDPAPERGECQWQELEHAFNRFFVGPAAPLAPPYASVYLETEPILMGASTMRVRDLLDELGLKVRDSGMPDDFLPCELEAWLVLVALQAKAGPALAQGARDALFWLVGAHMAEWIPQFASSVSKAIGQTTPRPDGTEWIRVAMNGLELWLQQCSKRKLYE